MAEERRRKGWRQRTDNVFCRVLGGKGKLMAYNKYGSRKTVVDGIKFDSRAEALRYKELRLMEKAGMIRDLKRQPEFLLQDKFEYSGKTERAVKYIADFKYFDVSRGVYVVEDVKGVETKVFKIKRKLFLKRYGEEYCFEIVKC